MAFSDMPDSRRHWQTERGTEVMKAKRLSLMSADFRRALVVGAGGGIGISAQDFGIVVSKRSLLGQVNFSLCVSVCVGLHIGNPQLRPGSWRMKGRFIFVHISPMPFTYNNTQPAVHGSDLSHEHTYYNIGVDISRPVELVLVARLWPVWVTGLMGSLWKEWCCMPCAAWTQPLGPDMSRLKWR